ncbi:MAG: S8 family serine peptidase [Halobacteriovoraceae bacterium]|nr:S8 family serine peptidase [Halobacteriovoraceae bacterium]
MTKFLKPLLVFLMFGQANAAILAIIDSGTDMKHEMIAPKAWINPVDSTVDNVDDDRNGYLDDVFGWNFAEGNNLVIDYKYLGTFSPDVFKFFEIQKKNYYGTVSKEEVDWVRKKLKEKEFIKELTIYGNFMHGTHVAGITSMNSEKAKVLAIKLLPTEVNLPGGNDEESSLQKIASKYSLPFKKTLITDEISSLSDDEDQPKNIGPNIKKIFKGLLRKVAVEQMNILKEIAYYCHKQGAVVANGSFGTGFRQAAGLIYQIFHMTLRKEPTSEDLYELTKYFMEQVMQNGQQMMNLAPKTLFVFAAGNDSSDNDVFPTSPTNIIAPNEISVAATFSNLSLARFSNYGATQVDVAAPGVAIRSSVPGNEYLEVSGTSQAAPYVANVAGQINDANPALTPRQVKKIIESTVDVKDFLVGKVKTSGIVNPKRAISAAQLSKSMPLNDAIIQAKETVPDRPSSNFKNNFLMPLSPFALPLQSEFVLK